MISRSHSMAVLWSAAATCSLGGLAFAGDSVEGKNNPMRLSGVLWAQYSYVLEDLSKADAIKDNNSFAIDRVYFTWECELDGDYVARARIEAQNLNRSNHPRIFLKNADIAVKDPFGIKRTKLRFGQTDGLISHWYDAAWGYRVVSKSTTDLYYDISTAYLGLGWTGHWLGGILETDLLVANRTGYSTDMSTAGGDSKYKSLGARAFLKPIRHGPVQDLGIGGYVQIAPDRSPPSDNRNVWFGGHAFFTAEKVVLGFQYDGRNHRQATAQGVLDTNAAVVSGIGRYRATDRIELFARGDLVDYDTGSSDFHEQPGLQVTYSPATARIIVGASHTYSKTLRSILDVQFVTVRDDVYDAGGVKKDFDDEIVLYARLDAGL